MAASAPATAAALLLFPGAVLCVMTHVVLCRLSYMLSQVQLSVMFGFTLNFPRKRAATFVWEYYRSEGFALTHICSESCVCVCMWCSGGDLNSAAAVFFRVPCSFGPPPGEACSPSLCAVFSLRVESVRAWLAPLLAHYKDMLSLR